MTLHSPPIPHALHVAPGTRVIPWQRWGALSARLALAAAFLSSVAARFGLWGAVLLSLPQARREPAPPGSPQP